MSKSITILDKEYSNWLKALSTRYRKSQIKAAVKVNEEMLRFYWELGREISALQKENKWGSKLLANISRDLKALNPDASCFSQTNLLYMKSFYSLYQPIFEFVPQVGEQLGELLITPQLVEQLKSDLFMVPWGNHRFIIDKYRNEPEKAIFYIRETVKNDWSRTLLLNFIDSGLYERNGKAVSNFSKTLPAVESDLAQELTKDPYNFDFTGMRAPYNERQLKDALIANIEKFLIELGTGFAYMGREYRLEVGNTEQFIDMLFYNVQLRCYIVIEVKTTEFTPAHVGQLGAYVVAVDHILCKEGDNKTIGLLVCKTKDNV